MSPLDLREVVAYIHANIKRKNPYLFKAKGNNSAHDFVKSVLDATVSSGEESTFGNFLEGVARFVCGKTYGGRKSSTTRLDLEFEDGETKYLIDIKSGPNWGNAAQVRQLVSGFNKAKRTLATSGGRAGLRIICVEGCCYGVDNVPDKGTHLKLCGERFWELISGGDVALYRDIIEPVGHQARVRNDEIEQAATAKLNTFTAAFVERFCNAGVIDWDRLVRFNSGKDRSVETEVALVLQSEPDADAGSPSGTSGT